MNRGGLKLLWQSLCFVLEHETRVARLVVLLPNGDDLINRHVANFIIFVLQMQDAVFNIYDFASDAGGPAAKSVNVLAD